MKYLETAKDKSGIETVNNYNKPFGLIDAFKNSNEILGYIKMNNEGYYFEPNVIQLTTDKLDALHVFFRELNREF